MSDIIRQARQTDLVEWLYQNNEPLKKAGKWWYIEGVDSLRIQGNKWFRNSQGKGGNAIDFLVDYYGLSPKEAIERLTQAHKPYIPDVFKETRGKKQKNSVDQSIVAKFDFNTINIACEQRRVFAYLTKTRGIDANIVLKEIQKGQLFEESYTGNAVFAVTNEVDHIVGAEVVGTLSFKNSRFKCMKKGSDNSYGYAIGQKRNPQYILFFESAIDLLSFITIMRNRSKPMTECLFVSMAGIKGGVIQKYLQSFIKSTPVICVDNDDAGNKFINYCLTQHPTTIIKQPDKKFKDWNDQLLGKCIPLVSNSACITNC